MEQLVFYQEFLIFWIKDRVLPVPHDDLTIADFKDPLLVAEILSSVNSREFCFASLKSEGSENGIQERVIQSLVDFFRNRNVTSRNLRENLKDAFENQKKRVEILEYIFTVAFLSESWQYDFGVLEQEGCFTPFYGLFSVQSKPGSALLMQAMIKILYKVLCSLKEYELTENENALTELIINNLNSNDIVTTPNRSRASSRHTNMPSSSNTTEIDLKMQIPTRTREDEELIYTLQLETSRLQKQLQAMKTEGDRKEVKLHEAETTLLEYEKRFNGERKRNLECVLELEDKVCQLERSQSSLEGQMTFADLKNQLEKANEEVRSLTRKVYEMEAMESRFRDLQSQVNHLEEIEKQHNDLKVTYEDLKKDREVDLVKIEDYEREKNVLDIYKNQLQKREEEWKVLGQRLKKLQGEQERAEALLEENNTLRNMLADSHRVQGELQDLADSLKFCRQTDMELDSDAELPSEGEGEGSPQAVIDRDRIIARLKDEVLDMRAKLDYYDKVDIDILRKKLQETQSKLNYMENSKSDYHYTKLKIEHVDLTLQVKALRDEIKTKSKEHKHEVRLAKFAIRSLAEENETLKLKEKDFILMRQEFDQLRKDFGLNQSDLDSTKEYVSSLRTALSQSKSEADKLRVEKQNLLQSQSVA
mmetsp:Transcript_11511/g.12648  ORF Transcript_11511/g.12648 Transcript_11511/m.12648 type:complete len:647 (-) Transcript_11511:298-2238(-)